MDFNHYLFSDAGLSILQQYFNQILTAVLEVLDDSDSSTRELALSLIAEMLNNQVWVFSFFEHKYLVVDRLSLFTLQIYFSQKDSIEDSMEIVLEKLLHVTKDAVAKVLPFFILPIVICRLDCVKISLLLCRFQMRQTNA